MFTLSIVMFGLCVLGYFERFSGFFSDFLKYGKTMQNPGSSESSINDERLLNKASYSKSVLVNAINLAVQVFLVQIPKR
jgi:hypothetical protein